jgi:proline iminopeptidase
MFVVGLLECVLYQRVLPKSMSEQFQLIFVELRGSGRSSGDPTSLSPSSAADDLDALRAELGLDQVAVFGHAIHGLFAAEYARRYPSTVSHVVMASTPAMVPDDTVQDFWRADSSPERQAAFERQLWSLPTDVFEQGYESSETFVQYRATLTADTWYQPDFDAHWLWEGVTAPPPLVNHLYGTLAPEWDAATVLRDIEAPVFVALGRWDYRVPYLSWLRHVDGLAGVTVQVFERSAHWVPIEQPHEFAESISNFVNSHTNDTCIPAR